MSSKREPHVCLHCGEAIDSEIRYRHGKDSYHPDCFPTMAFLPLPTTGRRVWVPGWRWQRAPLWRRRIHGFGAYLACAFIALFFPVEVDQRVHEALENQHLEHGMGDDGTV